MCPKIRCDGYCRNFFGNKTGPKLTSIYNEFQVDRNIQWILNHENHATQPVDRKNWHLNSLAAIQFIPTYLCSGSSNPNAHRTEPSHVHNMIRDGGTHCRPAQDALCRALRRHGHARRSCGRETKRCRWRAKRSISRTEESRSRDEALAAASEHRSLFFRWTNDRFSHNRSILLMVLSIKEQKTKGLFA